MYLDRARGNVGHGGFMLYHLTWEGVISSMSIDRNSESIGPIQIFRCFHLVSVPMVISYFIHAIIQPGNHLPSTITNQIITTTRQLLVSLYIVLSSGTATV